MNLFITGFDGFVGINVRKYLLRHSTIKLFRVSREQLNSSKNLFKSDLTSKTSSLLHLAGKAHDLKNTSNPEEYYKVNFELTKNLYDSFVDSELQKFIFISSIKAVADQTNETISENYFPNPQTPYGKSKLLAEQYIQSCLLPASKSYYILRPSMIHGPGNKGNLNLLYKIVATGMPWPLGKFQNERTFCSIENLSFIIKEIISRDDIPSGIYNVADDDSVSTNELVKLISEVLCIKFRKLNISKKLIIVVAKIGSACKLPFNTERLSKLTETFKVSNSKIVNALNLSLPIKAKDGLRLTFKSFSLYDK